MARNDPIGEPAADKDPQSVRCSLNHPPLGRGGGRRLAKPQT